MPRIQVQIPRPGATVWVHPAVGDIWEATVVSYTTTGELRVQSARSTTGHVQTIPADVYVATEVGS